MITCARCGQQVPPGYMMCPRCGAALQAARPGAGIADPNMPEWLRGAQGAPPGAPPAAGVAPGSLSVGSLLSDDAVPDWLRTAAGGGAPQPPAPDPWAARASPAGTPVTWSPQRPSPAAGGWSPPAAPTPVGAAQQMPGFMSGYAPPQSAAGMFNESALPEWLREATTGQPPIPAPHISPPSLFVSGMTPPAMPGPATPYPPQPYGAPASTSQYPGYGQPGGGLAANALFDAGALPTWLGGAGNGGQPVRPETPLGGDGVPMSSLVDERSLPLWLRQEPEQPQVQTPAPGSVSRWLSAPVTEEPMPPFLNQVYDAAQVTRAQVPPMQADYWGAASPPATPPMPGAVPSAHLLDDSALPQWLRAQADAPLQGQPPNAMPGQVYQAPAAYGAPGPGAAPASWGGFGPPAAPAPASAPGSSFAASDLIDPGAVPPWVQQGAPAPQPTFSSTMGWTDRTAAVPPYAGTGTNQGVAMNPGWGAGASGGPAESASLPSWLQTPNTPLDPGASAPWTSAHASVRRGREPSIPASDLPPWLQNGAPQPTAARGMPTSPQPQSTDQQWEELQRGWDGDDGGLYVDHFGAEEPGAGRPFSMDYDQQLRAADGANDDFTGEQAAGPRERGKGKRKRRGR